MSKQVTIHLARRVTLNRADHEAVELQAGRNLVDADVAAHPFVKAHTVDAGPDNSGELDDLRARIADLVKERDAAMAAQKAAEDACAGVAGRLSETAAWGAGMEKEKDAALARVADLEEQLAQKAADMDALVASMTPAAPALDAKPAKGKA